MSTAEVEVTRSRAYKKNDQAFVEQKKGSVVRRLIGYGRFEGVETAQAMGRLYAAARLYVNFFLPSFKLAEKWREGAKIIKRYHDPLTPYERALRHSQVPAAVKRRLRAQYRMLDPVALLAEIRAVQEELGDRIACRGLIGEAQPPASSPSPDADNFARTLGAVATRSERAQPIGSRSGSTRRGSACHQSSIRMWI